MKYFFFILMITMLSCPLFAQTPQSAMTVSGCNLLLMQFGWQDGQAVSLKELQNMLKTMRLPENYSITPQSGLDVIANLNALVTPSLVFHCTDDQQLAQNTVVRFYFSYLLPDNSTVNTPEFVVQRIVPSATAQSIQPQGTTVTQ